MHRLQDMGVPTQLIWGMMSLYMKVVGNVRTIQGISNLVHSTIEVEPCPLPPASIDVTLIAICKWYSHFVEILSVF